MEVSPTDQSPVESTDQEPSPPRSAGALRSIGGNALARMIALPVSAVLGIIVTRLIIGNYGQASYAQYSLVIGIGALLPFADLGIAAALMNATAGAKDPRTDENLRLVLVSGMRVLACSATVVILLSVVLTALGAWDNILGEGLMPGSGPVAAALCLAVIGATLTVSFGQRILAGLGQFHLVVILNGLQTPIVLGVVAAMIVLDVPGGGYVAVVSYLASFLIGVLALWLVSRRIHPMISSALRLAVRVRTVRGGKFLDTAWPMLIQMIALPFAMQTDRIVLSHVSTVDALTEYSLAAQMFNPVVSVVATAGIALWPIFAKARAEGVRSEVSPMRMSALFGAVAVGFAVLISLASGILADVASGGTISLSLQLLLAFSCLVVVQAVKYPLGMYMTDAKGLRYQAYMVLLMLPVNLGISWVLAARLGAVGPVIGSVVGVALFQVLANWVYVRRHQTRTATSVVDGAA